MKKIEDLKQSTDFLSPLLTFIQNLSERGIIVREKQHLEKEDDLDTIKSLYESCKVELTKDDFSYINRKSSATYKFFEDSKFGGIVTCDEFQESRIEKHATILFMAIFSSNEKSKESKFNKIIDELNKKYAKVINNLEFN